MSEAKQSDIEHAKEIRLALNLRKKELSDEMEYIIKKEYELYLTCPEAFPRKENI